MGNYYFNCYCLVMCCSDVDGVIRRANATEFGLASGVFSRDINKVREKKLIVIIINHLLGYVCE